MIFSKILPPHPVSFKMLFRGDVEMIDYDSLREDLKEECLGAFFVGSNSGYPYFAISEFSTSPFFGIPHLKEDEDVWNRMVNPKYAFNNWGYMDYVVDIDGKMMKMSDTAEEDGIQVRFIEGGCVITKLLTKEKIVVIPERIKGQKL